MYTLTQVTGGRGKNKTDDDYSFIKLGPVGSKDGDTWDEKGHSKIVQIFISHDDEINSIQFQYDENGTLVMSERHGDNHGCKFDVVELNHPAEYITWISGHQTYNHYSGRRSLCSITFGTNVGKYGPFGQFNDDDKEFSFRLGDRRQFGGFHGTADEYYVNSIGVYLKPITTLYCPVKENVV